MSGESEVSMEDGLLAEMPCYDNRNFSMYDSSKVLNRRPRVYISTKRDEDQPQVIVTEKRNILMRYFSKRWSLKNMQGSPSSTKKRDQSEVLEPGDAGPSSKHMRTS